MHFWDSESVRGDLMELLKHQRRIFKQFFSNFIQITNISSTQMSIPFSWLLKPVLACNRSKNFNFSSVINTGVR